jgi:nitroreductase
MKAILERRSIRKYTNKEVTWDVVESLLKAAMAAPSAHNEQPWHFVVINDKEIMKRIMEVHPYASMLKDAQYAIAVCGDMKLQKSEGYWVMDCSACTENILIAAQDLGLGAVWLGVYPREERMKGIKEILQLPDNVNPLSIISLGYPGEEIPPADRYDESRIHRNIW